jgi:hypothetical protein
MEQKKMTSPGSRSLKSYSHREDVLLNGCSSTVGAIRGVEAKKKKKKASLMK